jgi:hypothetical protein
MKPMFAAFAAIALIAIGSNYALDQAGFSSQEQGSSGSVRLD